MSVCTHPALDINNGKSNEEDDMGERKFDPGFDTPKANEPGAGQPVPGSPVWEDAQLRARVNEEQRQQEEQAATAQSDETDVVEDKTVEKSTKPTTRRSR